MPTIQVTTEISVKQLLDVVRQLPKRELNEFQRQFNQLENRSNGVSQKVNGKYRNTEEDLLIRIKINSRLPDAAHRRFNLLRRKLQDEKITETELKELQELTDRLEGMAVERLYALIELARLRGTDVESLMKELGLNKRRHA
jgi:hypothetical protein